MSENFARPSLNDPSHSVLPSCLRTRPDSTRRNRTFSVSFPEEENNLITGFLEPANPWEYAENVSREDLVSSYVASCERHGTSPLPKVVEQLEDLDVDGGRNESLDLRGAPLAAVACETLEEILKRVQFKSINLETTALDDEGSVALFDMIEYYESATHLNISGNRDIAGRGWHACSRLIKRTRCLEQLEARNVTLNEQYMPILSRALKLGTQLQILKLENCCLSGRPIIILAAALKLNSGLRELYLADNNLNVSDADLLGAVLRSNQMLQLLDVSNNQIQDAGVGHILDGLVDQTPRCNGNLNNGLCILIVWNNHLTRNAAKHLARALARSSSLETLNVGHNVLTNECLHVIKDSLQQNRTLLRLGMQSTHLTCEGAIALAECVAANPVIQRIDLRDNHLQLAGLLALSLSMRVNKSVSQLDLDDSPKKKLELDEAEEEPERYRALVAEIRAACQRNARAWAEGEGDAGAGGDEEVEGEEAGPEEEAEGTSKGRGRGRGRSAELRAPTPTASRKISLTCETLLRGATEPPSPTGQQLLAAQAVRGGGGGGGGRLRSPAPSPVPSPASSPVPSPSRTRFHVSRVAEAHSPCPSPCPSHSPSPSRFRVTLVEAVRPAAPAPAPAPASTPTRAPVAAAPPPAPAPVVAVAGVPARTVTVGFTFRLNDEDVAADPAAAPAPAPTAAAAVAATPGPVSKLSEALASARDDVPASPTVSLSSLDESADLEVRQILDASEARDAFDFKLPEAGGDEAQRAPVLQEEKEELTAKCSPVREDKTDAEKTVDAAAAPAAPAPRPRFQRRDTGAPKDWTWWDAGAQAEASSDKSSKCVNARQRKISWIAPALVCAPAAAAAASTPASSPATPSASASATPAEQHQKGASGLEKLLGLFQHPASFFSKAQPQYKATTAIVKQQPVANSNASFLLTAGPLAGAAAEAAAAAAAAAAARVDADDTSPSSPSPSPTPSPPTPSFGPPPADTINNNNHLNQLRGNPPAPVERERVRRMCSQCTPGERESPAHAPSPGPAPGDENFNVAKHGAGAATGADKLWCATLSSVCGANVMMSWAQSSSDAQRCDVASPAPAAPGAKDACASRLYSNVVKGAPPSNGVNVLLNSASVWAPKETSDCAAPLLPLTGVRLVGGGDLEGERPPTQPAPPPPPLDAAPAHPRDDARLVFGEYQ